MAYSLGLTLYQLAARRDAAGPVSYPPRPEGRLVWLHAPGRDASRGMVELARRLSIDDGCSVLLTCPDPLRVPHPVLHLPPPGDGISEVRGFLDHWHPDVIVMAEGELRPTLIHDAHERHIPMVMVEGRAPVLLRGREGWYPGLIKATLALLQEVQVLDASASKAFRKAGVDTVIAGRMEEGSAALPCNEAERAALARLLATRPVWLAADLPEAEETAVIEAHRSALRLAHRLLLIVVPENPDRAAPLTARMQEAEGWQVANRAADEEPEPETEVLIADGAEYGLWYRLAPITFMGGSLAGTGCLRDPLEPAALGSAIVHGPRPGLFGTIFGRLGAARAARSVASSYDLAEALGDLLSPDRAARHAQAAWAVASDGVEATDRVIALVRRMMGER